MLPLSSNTKPTERGASSPEKCATFCSTPSSSRWKSSFLKPENEAIQRIGHRHGDLHQGGIDAQFEFRLLARSSS